MLSMQSVCGQLFRLCWRTSWPSTRAKRSRWRQRSFGASLTSSSPTSRTCRQITWSTASRWPSTRSSRFGGSSIKNIDRLLNSDSTPIWVPISDAQSHRATTFPDCNFPDRNSLPGGHFTKNNRNNNRVIYLWPEYCSAGQSAGHSPYSLGLVEH